MNYFYTMGVVHLYWLPLQHKHRTRDLGWRNYFAKYKDIELTIHHETINQNKRYNLLNFKSRIGVIRNPYEWYLSIWKSTCKEKRRSPIYADLASIRLKLRRLKFNKRLSGYIFSQITKDRKKLGSLFENVHSKKNFNKHF